MAIGTSGEGRIRRGFRLLGQSVRFARTRPRMLVLPLVSALCLSASCALLGLAALALGDGSQWAFAIAFVAGAFPLTVISTFFNVAFLAMAADVADGFEPTVRGGLLAAEERLSPIVAWSALATLVGLLLNAIQQIPYIGGWLGSLVSFVGGLAWSLATFFVVPVIAMHGTGARESVRRSASAFRSKWGETVTGDLTIGIFVVFAMIPPTFVIITGIALWNDGAQVAGPALVALGVAAAAAVVTLSSAVTSLFQLFVYRHVALGDSSGPFAVEDLERAVKPKRRWFRR